MIQNMDGWKILRVLTTNKCNYECIYCHNEGQEHKNQNKMISLEQFIRFYNIGAEIGLKEVRFSGGEPLSNSETIKMIEWVNANTDVEVGIATNGSLVTEDIAKRLGKTRTMVTLHLPGVGKESYYTVTKRIWESFEKCVDLFDKYNVDYSFNYTLYPETIGFLDEVISYSIAKTKRVKLLPYLDPGFNNYSSSCIDEVSKKLDAMNASKIHYEKEGFYLWTFSTGGTVKIIDSPCYKKDINLCKEYGEIRLLPDLSLMNCIFGKSRSTYNKSDEEILSMFKSMYVEMNNCENILEMEKKFG